MPALRHLDFRTCASLGSHWSRIARLSPQPSAISREESSLRKKHSDGTFSGKYISALLLGISSRDYSHHHQIRNDANLDLVPTCTTYPRVSKRCIPREYPGHVYKTMAGRRPLSVRSGPYLAATYRQIPHRCVGTYHQLLRTEISDVR